MALLVTPQPPRSVRVTCSCGFIDCRIHDVALGVVMEAVNSVEVEHSC